jgi:23S rRNA (uridine2552-2'-O)-methyltransferase
MARSKSSKRWLNEHFDDEYVRRAQQEGYRSRAVYKLIEIQQKYHILKPGMTVIDLGAAPGSWSEYACSELGRNGRLIALDILAMEPMQGVEIIKGDFREDAVLEQLLQLLTGAGADLVISDMAPNISGMEAVDIPRSYHLAELALDLARQVLKPGGGLLVKLFQGEGFDDYVGELKHDFKRVVMRKPKASRARSREIYAMATGYKP